MSKQNEMSHVYGMADVVDLLQKILEKLEHIEEAIDEVRIASE